MARVQLMWQHTCSASRTRQPGYATSGLYESTSCSSLWPLAVSVCSGSCLGSVVCFNAGLLFDKDWDRLTAFGCSSPCWTETKASHIKRRQWYRWCKQS